MQMLSGDTSRPQRPLHYHANDWPQSFFSQTCAGALYICKHFAPSNLGAKLGRAYASQNSFWKVVGQLTRGPLTKARLSPPLLASLSVGPTRDSKAQGDVSGVGRRVRYRFHMKDFSIPIF